MNNHYYVDNRYFYGGNNNRGPVNSMQTKGWPYTAMQNVKGKADVISPGNVCATVSDAPVHYNKLNIAHWPSQDYTVPHPGGFSHKIHNEQHLGQYVPYRSYYQAPVNTLQQQQYYPQQPN